MVLKVFRLLAHDVMFYFFQISVCLFHFLGIIVTKFLFHFVLGGIIFHLF